MSDFTTRISRPATPAHDTIVAVGSSVAGAVQSSSTPDILAAACHEIRTPVAALHATVEVLSDYEALSTDEIGDLVSRLQRGLTWLEGMVENLTASALAESGDVPLQQAVIHVMECVDSAVAVTEPLLLKRRQRFIVSVPRKQPVIYADSRKITQALVNLLMNACSYSPDGSEIEVSVRAKERTVEVRVTDSGPGVPESERAQIFSQYARGHSGAARPAGLGLGLHIVKKFVELHGGIVGVENTPGRGASFWFTLPQVPLRNGAPFKPYAPTRARAHRRRARGRSDSANARRAVA